MEASDGSVALVGGDGSGNLVLLGAVVLCVHSDNALGIQIHVFEVPGNFLSHSIFCMASGVLAVNHDIGNSGIGVQGHIHIGQVRGSVSATANVHRQLSSDGVALHFADGLVHLHMGDSGVVALLQLENQIVHLNSAAVVGQAGNHNVLFPSALGAEPDKLIVRASHNVLGFLIEFHRRSGVAISSVLNLVGGVIDHFAVRIQDRGLGQSNSDGVGHIVQVGVNGGSGVLFAISAGDSELAQGLQIRGDLHGVSSNVVAGLGSNGEGVVVVSIHGPEPSSSSQRPSFPGPCRLHPHDGPALR